MTLPQLQTLLASSGIVGALLPAVIAVINRERWAGWVKALVTVLVSTAAGALTAWANGQFTGLGFTASALVVLGIAVASFHGIWKTSGLADAIEHSINSGPPAAPPAHKAG